MPLLVIPPHTIPLRYLSSIPSPSPTYLHLRHLHSCRVSWVAANELPSQPGCLDLASGLGQPPDLPFSFPCLSPTARLPSPVPSPSVTRTPYPVVARRLFRALGRCPRSTTPTSSAALAVCPARDSFNDIHPAPLLISRHCNSGAGLSPATCLSSAVPALASSLPQLTTAGPGRPSSLAARWPWALAIQGLLNNQAPAPPPPLDPQPPSSFHPTTIPSPSIHPPTSSSGLHLRSRPLHLHQPSPLVSSSSPPASQQASQPGY